MEAVIIVIHLMVIVALIAVVLLQRSEGGALGIGGSNAFLTGRGQGNVLTRATTILGIAFFLTSVALTALSRLQPPPSAILNTVQPTVAPITTPTPVAPAPGTPSSSAGTLNTAPAPILPGITTPPAGTVTPVTPAPSTAPAAPAPSTAPATPAPAAPAQ
jgi:preprotein translocase subunit SecG